MQTSRNKYGQFRSVHEKPRGTVWSEHSLPLKNPKERQTKARPPGTGQFLEPDAAFAPSHFTTSTYSFPLGRDLGLPGKHKHYVLEVEQRSFAEIEEAIAESASLLALSEDWDDEGALPIARPTLERATEALKSIASALNRKTGAVIPTPTIGPCADGSIDLFWKTETFKLLINIKPDGAQSDYYGETAKGHVIKGPFEISEAMYGFLQALIK